MAPSVGVFQPEHELGRGGLAAARFAHHAQRLAAFDGKGDVVDRAHHAAIGAEDAAPRREMLAETGGLQNGGHATLLLFISAFASASGTASQQRAVRPSSTATSGGASARQRANAMGQRGAKAQPGGSEERSGG